MRNRVGKLLHTVSLAVLFGTVFVPDTSFAQPPNPPTNCVPVKGVTPDGCNSPQPTGSPATKSFGGLSFGVGLGLSLDFQAHSRVASASVVNNIVRVTAEQSASAALVLESHYFFVPNVPFWWGDVPAGDWGYGPFVAIVADTGGSSQVVTSYALGWMIGLRQPTWTYNDKATGSDPKWTATYSSSSWNFGVGIRVDPQAQILGDGIMPNQPLPAGETSMRFKTLPLYGVMLISSFSF